MRTKLEIIGGLILLVVLGLFVREKWNHALEVAAAQVQAEVQKKAQHDLDEQIKTISDQEKQLQSDYQKRLDSLGKMTPQQIVLKVPEYVPQATQPVQVLTPESPAVKSGAAAAGDAIVPAADIKPLAQAILDGDNCKKALPLCQKDVDTWKGKYDLKEKESANWEKAAKGGSIWKRVGKDILKIGVGVGVGYALHR